MFLIKLFDGLQQFFLAQLLFRPKVTTGDQDGWADKRRFSNGPCRFVGV